jgi:uncharacterized protein YndB with AHSA1/START domain
MPVTDVQKDLDALTMTMTAEFDAGVERLWELWADPRQLERWWGPPSHPTTFTEHELTPGARTAYYMTGPDGQRTHGWWRIAEVEEPHRLLIFDDDEAGRASAGAPAEVQTLGDRGSDGIGAMEVTLSESGGRTTMVVETRFTDRESMEETLETGAEQGMREVLAQIDALLA